MSMGTKHFVSRCQLLCYPRHAVWSGMCVFKHWKIAWCNQRSRSSAEPCPWRNPVIAWRQKAEHNIHAVLASLNSGCISHATYYAFIRVCAGDSLTLPTTHWFSLRTRGAWPPWPLYASKWLSATQAAVDVKPTDGRIFISSPFLPPISIFTRYSQGRLVSAVNARVRLSSCSQVSRTAGSASVNYSGSWEIILPQAVTRRSVTPFSDSRLACTFARATQRHNRPCPCCSILLRSYAKTESDTAAALPVAKVSYHTAKNTRPYSSTGCPSCRQAGHTHTRNWLNSRP
jgi:hypothetical protein